MPQRLIHPAFTSTFVLVALAASCGVTRDASTDTVVVGQALEVADFAIGTDKPVAEQYSSGTYPSVAASGANRLAVFEDGGRIRGVRFDDSGAVLDLEWLDFGVEERTQVYPAVAFGAERYLVVWSELEDTGATIYGQIVTLDGQIQGERQPLATGFDPQVCWLGDSFFMSYTDNGVNLVRLSSEGAVTSGSTIKVTSDTVTSATRPVIAASETSGAVAFSEDDGTRRNVRVARFNAEGELLDPGGVVVNPTIQGTSEYALATTNDRSLITFKDETNRITASLFLSDGTLEVTELEVGTGDIGGHAAGTDGTNFVVVWDAAADGAREIHGVNVAANGTVADGESGLAGRPQAGQAMNMDLTFNNGTYAVVYQGEGVWGEQFTPDFGVDGSPLPLSALPNAQNLPFGAWDGSQYIVSFNDERNEGFQSRAVRVSKEGRVLDPEGIAVSPEDRQAFTSASASNSLGTTAFVFTTLEESSAYLRTMNSAGELSDTILLAEGSPQGVDVVTNGTTFLVGYQLGAEPTSQSMTHYVQPLSESGEPVGEAVPVLPDFSRPRITMAAQGEDFLLTYSGQTQDTGAPIDGKLLRISTSGETLAELEPPSTGNPFYTVASNPDGAVVFGWNDVDTQEVWFRILTGDSWSESKLLTTQPSEEAPAFGWDGSKFVSVWVERRTALWTRDVSLDTTLGEESVAVSGDHTWPKLTLGPGPELLLTSVHWELFSRTRRIESRFVGADGSVLPHAPIELDATADTSTVNIGSSETGSDNTDSGTATTTKPAPSSGGDTSPEPTTKPVAPADTSTIGAPTSASTTTSNQATSASDTQEATSRQGSQKSSGGCTIGNDTNNHPVPTWLLASVGALILRSRRRRLTV